MMNVKNRTLFCHDNLEVLQGMNSESVDLIYLDPPFNKDKEFSGTTKKMKREKLEFQILTPHFQEIEKAAHEKFNYALEWVRGDLKEIINFVKNYK